MASASDNFNRADGGLGANWTAGSGGATYTGLVISSNAVRDPSFADAFLAVSFYTAIAWLPDQYCQIIAVTAANAGSSVGLDLRGLSATDTFYRFAVNGAFGGVVNISIRKVVANVDTSVADSTATVNANDVLGFQVKGTSLTAFINGVAVLTGADSDIDAGYPGAEAYAGSALTDTSMDNWSANDFAINSFRDFPKPKIRDAVRAGWIA